MTEERFREIMNDDDSKTNFPKEDNALIGLNIIAKYLPLSGVEGANHDVIYACDVEEIVKAGITEKDALYLREINWMIDEDCDCLACFV